MSLATWLSVQILRALPRRSLSRTVGRVCEMPLSPRMSAAATRTFAALAGVDMSDVAPRPSTTARPCPTEGRSSYGCRSAATTTNAPCPTPACSAWISGMSGDPPNKVCAHARTSKPPLRSRSSTSAAE